MHRFKQRLLQSNAAAAAPSAPSATSAEGACSLALPLSATISLPTRRIIFYIFSL